jgi:predicted DNA-binding protein
MIDKNKSEKIATRFSAKTFQRIASYADERGMTKSEAIRFLVEDRLDEMGHKDRDRASFERILKVGEYLVASAIAYNTEKYSDEAYQNIVKNMRHFVASHHPQIDEDK